MPRWTKEQELAINQENTNILVSAGAGSGKTAVLSERALRKVKENVNIDEILILTFTKAAAYEMMLRIRKKIQENGFQEQVNRIDKAYITTFDSFALSIVKKYHDRLNLKKEVSIIDEHAINLVKTELLDEIFQKYYQKEDPGFINFITDFSLRDDKEVKKYILDINDKLDLKYDKKEYLDSYLEKYYDFNLVNKKVAEYENMLQDIIHNIEGILRELELELDGDDYDNFYQVLLPLLDATSYDEIKSSLDIKLPRLPKNSSESIKKEKDDIKKYIEELINLCLFENKKQMVEDYLSTKNNLKVMIDIILKLDEKITSYKYNHDTFEFVDISKLAIDLVTKYPDIREELKNYFNEIMIDEYQDTSDLQEQFIKLIENHNTYMVGDIKQSIYRFRNANPLIFKEKYDKYAQNIDGIKIDLNKNFRSRKEVLDNINEFFDCVMDDTFGGANYQESHRMVFGNNTYIEEGLTEQNYNINVLNYQIEKDSPYKKYTKDEIEAFLIADDIKKKIENKYQVFDKDTGILRDIEYSDFVILMDRSSKFTLYKKIFEYMKIPLTILRDENIMDQNEVYLIRNILKLLECLEFKKFDNEFKYSFTSIARSYLFSLKDQEIFHIINENLFLETDILKIAQELVSDISTVSLHELLELIIEKFDFSSKIITYGSVEMGLSVLDYFLELASNLEELGYDYHRFIEYLDYIIKNQKQIKIPVSVSDSNSAQIMTIHKSKGLEFPICYYSGLSLSFNVSDLKEKILFDNDYGIILPSFHNGYQDTFYKGLLKKKYMKEEISEKIRLFYVALTRCKEQMIIVSNMESEETTLQEGVVRYAKREQYRSFLDILKSIYAIVEPYMIQVPLDSIYLSQDYKMISMDKKLEEKEADSLIVSEYNGEKSISLESSHFSKTTHDLLTLEKKKNMEFGSKIHEKLEMIDFINPNFEGLTDYEREKIEAFLNQPLLKNRKDANILKEYEFYEIDGEKKKHGIIDLLLEYPDHIDIIDYKLKNIEDDAYLDQLHGYRDYIKEKRKKPVFLYLYSILDNNFKKID